MSLAAPITTWHACVRCAHGRDGGARCAHQHVLIAHGAPQPVDVVRAAEHLCGRDGRWHLYAAPAPAAAAQAAAAGAAL